MQSKLKKYKLGVRLKCYPLDTLHWMYAYGRNRTEAKNNLIGELGDEYIVKKCEEVKE